MKNWKRTYHIWSRSEQARRRANNLFVYVMDTVHSDRELGFFDTMGEYHDNVTPEQYAAHSLSISHKPKIIRYRAAKRFGRMWRKHLAK